MSAPLNHSLVAVTFEHHPPFERFEKVPPHITVLPWFDARGKVELIDEIVSQTEPFSIRQGELTTVGASGHEKSAVRIISPGLLEFHKKLFDELVGSGVRFSDLEWLNENYNPHYRSDQVRKDPFAAHPEIMVGEIALVDNISSNGQPPGDKVISYLRLGDA